QRGANGLTEGEIVIEESAIREVVRAYTREAGVRTLERQIASLCRKVAREISERTTDSSAANGPAESDVTIAKDTSTHGAQAPILEMPSANPTDLGEIDPVGDGAGDATSGATARPVIVDVAAVHRLLGREQFHNEQAERIDRPGVATGLVWTPVGGDIVFVEAARTPSKEERLVLTGQLGDVMKESAQAALTCVRAGSTRLGIDQALWDQSTLHIHVPAGAVPKDGPSAGVTMALAIASLMTGRPVRADLALTGEITLRGKVLPVGGIKEKMLGAHRAGIRTVLIPRQNERDLDDLPPELRAEMRFIPVSEIQEVFDEALLPVVTEPILEAERISA
ncbi:MAG TPA: S16 family serine protease, partial [Chloroflexota bacterium]